MGSETMSLLIIEDDRTERMGFLSLTEFKDVIVFYGITCSSREALGLLNFKMPDAIILDLELHKGEGSGLEFLSKLRENKTASKPIIVVTTNTPSGLVYNAARSLGVDYIFYKRQKGYSPKHVIETLLLIKGAFWDVQHEESVNDQSINQERVVNMIDKELNNIGISGRHRGRSYLKDSILFFINNDMKVSDSVIGRVAKDANVVYSSVIRAIQTAIKNAWDSSDSDEITTHYTAPIDKRIGYPTPSEFIRFYAEKIYKNLRKPHN